MSLQLDNMSTAAETVFRREPFKPFTRLKSALRYVKEQVRTTREEPTVQGVLEEVARDALYYAGDHKMLAYSIQESMQYEKLLHILRQAGSSNTVTGQMNTPEGKLVVMPGCRFLDCWHFRESTNEEGRPVVSIIRILGNSDASCVLRADFIKELKTGSGRQLLERNKIKFDGTGQIKQVVVKRGGKKTFVLEMNF